MKQRCKVSGCDKRHFLMWSYGIPEADLRLLSAFRYEVGTPYVYQHRDLTLVLKKTTHRPIILSELVECIRYSDTTLCVFLPQDVSEDSRKVTTLVGVKLIF